MSHDAKAIQAAAHAFKSGAGTIHATVLAAALASAENAARGGHLGTHGPARADSPEHHAVLLI